MATKAFEPTGVPGVYVVTLENDDVSAWVQLSGDGNALAYVEARTTGSDFGGGELRVETSAVGAAEGGDVPGLPAVQPDGTAVPALAEDGALEFSTGAPYFRAALVGGSGEAVKVYATGLF